MRARIIGFSFALLALGFLGHSLVGPPAVLQEVMDGLGGEALAQESVGDRVEEPLEPEQDDLEVEEGPELGEPPTPEEEEALRREAREAQGRAQALLEEAQRAQEEAIRAQERVTRLEGGELSEEEEETTTDVDELARRIEELEARLDELQADRDITEEELTLLEEQIESLEERAEFLEQNRLQRISRLEQGMDEIQAVASALATGDGDVGAALDDLSRQLGATSEEAALYAGEEEARWSDAAQRSVLAAREALERQDLYAARAALAIALRQARAAQSAAETTAPGPLTP